jgi:hypothetical protein
VALRSSFGGLSILFCTSTSHFFHLLTHLYPVHTSSVSKPSFPLSRSFQLILNICIVSSNAPRCVSFFARGRLNPLSPTLLGRLSVRIPRDRALSYPSPCFLSLSRPSFGLPSHQTPSDSHFARPGLEILGMSSSEEDIPLARSSINGGM